MSIHTVSFKGHEFRIQEGTVHPAYSVECFQEGKDESAFRNEFWNIQPGDVVVDAGASYGAYALTAAACGADVMAFEPEPTVCVDLASNAELNDWTHCTPWTPWGRLRVEVCCLGLSDKTEAVHMHSYAPHWPAGTVSGAYFMRPLDYFRPSRLDWLKVDVEGYEDRVLRGAMETLKRCRPTCIIEVHTFLDPTLLDRCKALLSEAGYERFEEVPRDPCVMLIARPS